MLFYNSIIVNNNCKLSNRLYNVRLGFACNRRNMNGRVESPLTCVPWK